MAHTERRRWVPPQSDPAGAWRLDDSARDTGCQHWACNGWKRPARRAQRHQAKAAMRRNPDNMPGRARSY